MTLKRVKCKKMTVQEFMRRQIEGLEDDERFGTARNYRKALNSFTEYAGDGHLSFAALTERFVAGYNAWLLRRGVVRNTVSFYMRIWRAVYNRAVGQRLVEQAFPFRHVYTGIARTRKRAVGEEVIVRLAGLDLESSRPLRLARDLFLFSFYTRGMAFVDMAYLKKTDVRDGAIRYVRHKSAQVLSVRLEPCMKEIMERYAFSGSPYVFPLLTDGGEGEAYRQYESALGYYNRCLKRLSDLLGLEQGLSSYMSRHSWASVARNHQVPVAVISEGMGHSSEQTTRIYLAALENAVIDDANRRIIEALKVKKS